MKNRSERALGLADDLKKVVDEMISQTSNLDLKRLLKQIDADLMDIKHKLARALQLSGGGGSK